MPRLPAILASIACMPVLFAAPAIPSGAQVRPPAAADGCARAYCPEDAVFQAVPLQGLLAGVLESPITFASVLEHGDFGLGGMSPLDGEAIVLDGQPYHARLDGSLRRVDPAERTAALWVKRFRPDRSLPLAPFRDFDSLVRQLDAAIGLPNRVHAIRVDGRFERLTARSVPRQSPPYAPVTDVVKSQHVFVREGVEGTLVGFRFPAWASGVNAPGYHFHFVAADRTVGGHVLDIEGAGLVAKIDTTRSLMVVTPDDTLFDNADFTDPSDGDGYRRAFRPGSTPEPGP